MNPLYISTSSKIKLDHYRKFFNPLLYEVHSINLQLPEIQAIEPNQVVLAKLEYAARNTELRPLIVDDVGLSLPNFSGFPGALLKPILELGGLKLLRDLCTSQLENNKIESQLICAIAIAPNLTNQASSLVFEGTMKGILNFSENNYLNDRETLRCFYPTGQLNSIFELMGNNPEIGFKHRFQAMELLHNFLNHK